jgi:dihydrofolate reductase
VRRRGAVESPSFKTGDPNADGFRVQDLASPEPLTGRRNIVVSRSGMVSGTGREVAKTIEYAITLARATDPDPFVVGGAQIFQLAFPYATRLLITELDFDAVGDTFFPKFDLSQWRTTQRRPGDRAMYVTYVRC